MYRITKITYLYFSACTYKYISFLPKWWELLYKTNSSAFCVHLGLLMSKGTQSALCFSFFTFHNFQCKWLLIQRSSTCMRARTHNMKWLLSHCHFSKYLCFLRRLLFEQKRHFLKFIDTPPSKIQKWPTYHVFVCSLTALSGVIGPL